MKPMRYRGYEARIEYSDEDGCFVGHVAGLNDVVGFHGSSINELKAAFEESVDDYLATCEKLGRKPDKAYSGKLMLRISPKVHSIAARRAEAVGKSLNQWVTEVITKAVG